MINLLKITLLLLELHLSSLVARGDETGNLDQSSETNLVAGLVSFKDRYKDYAAKRAELETETIELHEAMKQWARSWISVKTRLSTLKQNLEDIKPEYFKLKDFKQYVALLKEDANVTDIWELLRQIQEALEEKRHTLNMEYSFESGIFGSLLQEEAKPSEDFPRADSENQFERLLAETVDSQADEADRERQLERQHHEEEYKKALAEAEEGEKTNFEVWGDVAQWSRRWEAFKERYVELVERVRGMRFEEAYGENAGEFESLLKERLEIVAGLHRGRQRLDERIEEMLGSSLCKYETQEEQARRIEDLEQEMKELEHELETATEEHDEL